MRWRGACAAARGAAGRQPRASRPPRCQHVARLAMVAPAPLRPGAPDVLSPRPCPLSGGVGVPDTPREGGDSLWWSRRGGVRARPPRRVRRGRRALIRAVRCWARLGPAATGRVGVTGWPLLLLAPLPPPPPPPPSPPSAHLFLAALCSARGCACKRLASTPRSRPPPLVLPCIALRVVP